MRKFAFMLAACLVGAMWSAPGRTEDTKGLTRVDFDKLHKELTAVKEPWQSIPWHVSILEARAQAAKENKPVYMLCRAGHPLGCV